MSKNILNGIKKIISTNEIKIIHCSEIKEKEIDLSCKELLEKEVVFGITDFIATVNK